MKINCYGFLCLLSSLMLSACGALPKGPVPDDPAFAPVIRPQLDQPSLVNGAIYQAHTKLSLFSDRKARNVGDILLVNLVERTTATKESETEVKKETTQSLAEPTLFQRVNNFGLESSYDNATEFKGEADSDLKNSLQGSISVTVTKVFPNGVLQVRGEKWLTLNQGDEYIRVSGLVRPDDISPSNSINSTQIADARIAYSQKGDLAQTNRMGWLTRFFNSTLWPL